MPRHAPPRPIVVDANILLAALIKDGTTRGIMLHRGLDLRSPPWLWEEIAARYDWLQEKTQLPVPVLDELLRQLRERITDVPAALIAAQRVAALERAGTAGSKDAPYIAAALAVDAVIWTHDSLLLELDTVETVTTAAILDWLGTP